VGGAGRRVAALGLTATPGYRWKESWGRTAQTLLRVLNNDGVNRSRAWTNSSRRLLAWPASSRS